MNLAISSASKRAVAAIALVCMAVSSPVVFSQTSAQRESYEKLLGAVKSLTAAAQREPGATSGDGSAVLATIAARQKEAEELAAAGEYGVARSILEEGYRSLTQALSSLKSGTGFAGASGSGAATAGGSGDAARKASYERQMGTALALLDAAKRASAETQGSRAADVGRIENILTQSRSVASGGDFVQADALVGEGLKELRTLMVAMKGGSGETRAAVASDSATQSGKSPPTFDFDSRFSTANALVEALRRQNVEKNAGKDRVIADIETRLSRAQSLRGSDSPAALALLDETYSLTRNTLQGMQSASKLKTGSAALEASRVAEVPSTGENQRAEAKRQLDSAKLIRDAAERIGRDKGSNIASALAQIDTIASDARNYLASDPARANESAAEANRLAKEALEKARGGH